MSTIFQKYGPIQRFIERRVGVYNNTLATKADVKTITEAVGGSSGTAGASIEQIQAELAKLPTAAQNGDAARTAIVK